MQQIYLEAYFKGYARKAMRSLTNITQHQHYQIINKRINIISFYDDYGAEATRRAFQVSRSTIYLWKQKLATGHGRLEALAPGSKTPKTKRQRHIHPVITDFIVLQRQLHPRLGKDKLASLLKSVCQSQGLVCPSVSTVGRIIHDLKLQGKLPTDRRLRLQGGTGRLHQYKFKLKLDKTRRGSFYPKQPGELVQIDCVIKFINGVRRYVISAIDYHSEFAFSLGCVHLSSAKTKDFLLKFNQLAPFDLKRVQTDNGSEFYKCFHDACEQLELTHFWNYPRSPKMNAKIERFNRTIQEEFVDWHLDDLAYDIDKFNLDYMDWLIWYNTERPHWTLKLKSPMQFLLEQLQLTPTESNMLWTDTLT